MNSLLIKVTFAAIFITFLCIGCTPEKIEAEQVSGVYMWEHQDGRVEIWCIHPDYQFEQKFYRNAFDYKNNKPFYTYHNTWAFQPGNARPVIAFQRSCTLIDFGTDRVLNAPEEITGQIAGWENDAGGRTPYLDFFADKGYIAYKLINKSDATGKTLK